jgi:predicted ribosomally synthesized peptide with SipW-like signal peptide
LGLLEKLLTLFNLIIAMINKARYSIALIVLVGGLAAAGTYAYFTATRTTSANRFAAGTLDLNVASNGNALEPFVIENLGDNANISGTKTWTVKNTGSLPGRLLIRLQNVVNTENGCNDQEKTADPTCEDPGKQGDLGNAITLNVALDGADQVSSTLATDQQTSIGAQWAALTPIVLAANEERTITAHWAADENSYGNEIQGDDVQFDMNFRLIQIINGEAPSNL